MAQKPRPLELEVWITIELGRYSQGSDILDDFISNGMDIDGNVQETLRKNLIDLSAEEITVDLFKVTTRQLGFTNIHPLYGGPTTRDLWYPVNEFGFQFLSPEMALVARAFYKRQKKGETLYVPLNDELQVNDTRWVHLFYLWNTFGRPQLKTFQDFYPQFNWNYNLTWVIAKVRK